MATETNLTFVLGDTWPIDFALNDEAGDDLDVTGADIVFIMAVDGDIVLRLSSLDSPNRFTMESPAVGNGSVDILPEDQTDFEPIVYNFDIRATLQGGQVTTQAFGKIIVQAGLASWPVVSG